MRILIDSPNDPVLQTAAEMLRVFLARLFGITVVSLVADGSSLQPPDRDSFASMTDVDFHLSLPEKATTPLAQQSYQIRVRGDGIRQTADLTGGSPVAVLWAVCELAELWGVRFLLDADSYPERQPFWLPDVDIQRTPELAIRAWGLPFGLPTGPEGWDAQAFERLIPQLAKLKFNRLTFQLYPLFPLFDLEYAGIRRSSRSFFLGQKLPLSADSSAAAFFPDQSAFTQPAIDPEAPAEAQYAAAAHLIGDAMDLAHRYGLECVINATINEFLPEFASVLPGTVETTLLQDRYLVPGPDLAPESTALQDFAQYILDRTIATFPQTDAISLVLPEWPNWQAKAKDAYIALDRLYGISALATLEDMLEQAARRTEYPGGAARALDEVRGDISAVYYFALLIARWRDSRPAADRRRLIVLYAAEELFPILPAIWEPDLEFGFYMDYTPARVLRRHDRLNSLDAAGRPVYLMATLQDDNIGLIPQSTIEPLDWLLRDLRRAAWSGFTTRCWILSGLDAAVACLAAAAWDGAGHSWQRLRAWGTDLCGAKAAPALIGMLQEVELATRILEWEQLSFSFPTPRMLMQHWHPDSAGEPFISIRQSYERALAWAEKLTQYSHARGQTFAAKWVERLRFAVFYLLTVETLGLAAKAEQEGSLAQAAALAGQAEQRLQTAITAHLAAAAQHSEAGVLACLCAFAEAPLASKRQALEKALDEQPCTGF